MGLVKVKFADLRTGMIVSKPDLRVYEVLMASIGQVLMLKNNKTACVISAEEFEAHDWYMAVRRRTRRNHGKA